MKRKAKTPHFCIRISTSELEMLKVEFSKIQARHRDVINLIRVKLIMYTHSHLNKNDKQQTTIQDATDVC